MTKPPQVPVPAWQFYFNVPISRRAQSALPTMAATITMGPMEVPDGSWVVNAQDPQGAHFALLAAK